MGIEPSPVGLRYISGLAVIQHLLGGRCSQVHCRGPL
jgi:hypothetical protein